MLRRAWYLGWYYLGWGGAIIDVKSHLLPSREHVGKCCHTKFPLWGGSWGWRERVSMYEGRIVGVDADTSTTGTQYLIEITDPDAPKRFHKRYSMHYSRVFVFEHVVPRDKEVPWPESIPYDPDKERRA